MEGRRVATNIDGIKPDAVVAYCRSKMDEPSRVGSVVLFEGEQAKDKGFWPTQAIPDDETFIKGGDLVVFDEWKLYFPRRGMLPCTPPKTADNPSPISDVEGFLRWHRHLLGIRSDGVSVACDVAIGTQLVSDIHQDFRGLVERSFKFKKLKSVGLSKSYAWQMFDGHLQEKGKAENKGGPIPYKKEVFALYKSYGGEGNGTELQTDGRVSIWGKGTIASIAAGVVGVAFGIWWVWGFFAGDAVPVSKPAAPASARVGAPASAVSVPDRSMWIAGAVSGGEGGVRVVVLDDKGGARFMPPDGFRFEDDRPVSGYVDGRRVVAEDRADLFGAAPAALPGFGL
jgi:zona occludens toxin